MLSKKKELIEEISTLEKENQELTSAIKKIDNKENFETVKHFTYRYRKSFYRKIPFSYIDSVFFSYKNIILKHANGCFIEKILDVAYDTSRERNMTDLVMNIPMYCSETIKTDKGIIFVLNDPYRTISTLPMATVSDNAANICKGRIIIAQLTIPENHRAVTYFEMKGYRLLKMNFTNIIGKDPPATNKLFMQFKDVKGEENAIKAIDTIENHFNSFGNTEIQRENSSTLRILTDTSLLGVSYEKGKLWYAQEPSGQLLICQSIKQSLGTDYLIHSKHCFVFEDERTFPI